MTTKPNPVPPAPAAKPAVKTAPATPPPARPRRISRREAQEAAARLQTDHRGQRVIVRFSLGQRVEHQVLIISFTLLVITGLPQGQAERVQAQDPEWRVNGKRGVVQARL